MLIAMRFFSESILMIFASICWPAESTSDGLLTRCQEISPTCKQSVGAADIDERAVVGEAADFALHGVAFFQFGVAALLAGALFVFGNDAAIDDDVFVRPHRA